MNYNDAYTSLNELQFHNNFSGEKITKKYVYNGNNDIFNHVNQK